VLVHPAPVPQVRIFVAANPPALAGAPVAAPRQAAPVARPKPRPAVRVVATRVRVSTPVPPPRTEVVGVGPQGRAIRIFERPSTEEDSLVCVHDVATIGDVCVGKV